MFVPVEPWIQKANRDLVLQVKNLSPDIVMVFGRNRVLSGALAQIRATTCTTFVLVWPDTLLNLGPALTINLPLYDLIATYANSTISAFERLGARRVVWLPLAADPHLHASSIAPLKYQHDVGFIGQWRPEREQAMAWLMRASPDIKLRIWGPDWIRRTRNNALRRVVQGRSLYAAAFSEAVRNCRMNMNVIDATNYPAANMRFFEIPCAGGLQICSPCPEMEKEFIHAETIFYYRSLDELADLVRSLRRDDAQCQRVARNANSLVLDKHTYKHRAQTILSLL
jgi:spore maturation protein CgeB